MSGVLDSPHFGIEARIVGEPRRIGLAPAAALPPLSLILAALRLYRGRGIWLTSVTAKSNSPMDDEGLTWQPFEWTGHRIDPHCSDTEPYLLRRLDSDPLCESLGKVWEIYYEQPNIRRSLDLYNEAFEQSTRQASLLRMWGAIESAFVPRGSRRIADTAATNVSQLLWPSGGERDGLRQKLRDSYRRRSELVHGSASLSDLDLMHECWLATDSYRKAMASLLRLPMADEHEED
jgi:Apea-like HEPN